MTRLQCVLLLSGSVLCALLWLVLPPLLFRAEAALGWGRHGTRRGATGAPVVGELVTHTGPGPAHGAPDAAWSAWAPFSVQSGSVGEVRLVDAAALAQAPAAASARVRSRGGAAPPGFTLEQTEVAAARVSPDVFAALPASYSPDYKAPCWRTDANELQCLPYFYVLGVFQCGVRDLMSRLLLHKDCAATLNSAPHFWDEVHAFNTSYLALFKPALSKVEAFPQRTVFGDGSLSTFTFTWTGSERLHAEWTSAFRACREKDCDNKQQCVDETCFAKADLVPVGGGANLTLPWLLRSVLGAGNAKLIVLLRDPVERLHVAFFNYEHYGRVYGKDAAGFRKFALEMTGHVSRCLEAGHGEHKCVTAFESLGPSYESVFYHADQVLKSMYAPFLEGYLAAFPAEEVLVLRFEDYAAEAGVRATLQRVFTHLEMDDPDAATWMAMLSAPIARNGGAQQPSPRPPMDADTRRHLQAFYRPYNERLVALLNDDPRWLWEN